MSDVKKCDRCGKTYMPSAKSRVVHEFYSSGIGVTKNGGDLCPKCSERFGKWWNKKRGGME